MLPTIVPVLLKIRKTPFVDRHWIFDLKYDGFRALAYFDGTTCKLISKQGKRLPFPQVERQLASVLGTRPVILDGEVIAHNKEGRPIFQNLIKRQPPFSYIGFDLLFLGDQDLRTWPLKERRRRLKVLAKNKFPVCVSVVERGDLLFKLICEHDLEGMVAKRLDEAYTRRATWYKIKNPAYGQKRRWQRPTTE